jgi:hypothetical protein
MRNRSTCLELGWGPATRASAEFLDLSSNLTAPQSTNEFSVWIIRWNTSIFVVLSHQSQSARTASTRPYHCLPSRLFLVILLPIIMISRRHLSELEYKDILSGNQIINPQTGLRSFVHESAGSGTAQQISRECRIMLVRSIEGESSLQGKDIRSGEHRSSNQSGSSH